MLYRFGGLSDASDQQILRFAQRYGPLDARLGYRLGKYRVGDGHGWEPLATWRKRSLETRAMLQIGAELLAPTPGLGSDDDWRVLVPDIDEVWELLAPSTMTRAAAVNMRRHLLGQHLAEDWLPARSGDVRAPATPTWLTIEWDESAGSFTMVSAGAGLLAAIAFHLMLDLCRTPGFVVCTNCGEVYTPPRRLRVGQRGYCDAKAECQRARARDYKRDQRRQPSG